MPRSINIKFPLRKSSKGGFQTNDSTLDAVTDDLRILILTNHGERPIHFDFGANLRSVIFEQGENVRQKVKDSIYAAVEKWMPFVLLTDVQVDDSTTNNTLLPNEVHVKIEFSVNQIKGLLTQRIRA